MNRYLKSPHRQGMHMITSRLAMVIISLSMLLASSGCALNPATGNTDFVLLSEDDEISLGRKSHAEILEKYGEYNNPALQAYVRKVGTEIAANSHRNNLIYHFTVLDSKIVNAFALPGGYVYITRGIMAYLQSEAELAAVLAHEIGHVTARHSVRQYTTAVTTNVIGAIIAAQSGTNYAQDLSNILATAITRGYGRDHELEADRLGAGYLARSNYSPDAMIRIIELLKTQEEFDKQLASEEQREASSYHGIFSTHPENDTRLQEVVKAAKPSQPHSNAYRVGRDDYLHAINGMTYGDSPEEGIVYDNSFYHADLDFSLTFPHGWRISNRPSSLLAHSPDGQAMLQLVVTDRNRRISPQQFIKKRLDIDDPEGGHASHINGLQAYTTTGKMRTPYGYRRTRVTVLYMGEKAYLLFGTSKNDTLPQSLASQFRQTENSFHRMTDQDRKHAVARRIVIKQITRETSFEELASESGLSDHAAARLRLLNAAYPDKQPELHQNIKLVK